MEKKHCKWYNDEFCTNDKSPCVADYCPVGEYPELCKCREEYTHIVSDDDIAKAFETCNAMGMSCNDCPFDKNGDECEGVEQLTIDLIKRLQSEIAEYERKLADGELCSMDYHEEQMGVLNCEIETYKAEIERLKEGKKTLVWLNQDLKKQVDEQENEIDRLEKVVHEQAEQYYNLEQRTAVEILQRGRYCMPSGLRDWIEERYGVEVE